MQIGAFPILEIAMDRQSRQHRTGFSLLELVIVVTIMGIIAAIAVPRFGEASEGRRLQAARNILLDDIQAAKLRARATSKQHVIQFYPDKEMYAIFEGNEIKGGALVLSRTLSEDPFNIEIHRTNLTGDLVAIITPFGDLSPPFRIQLIENSTTLTVNLDGIADTGKSVVVTDSADQVLDSVDKLTGFDVGVSK